MSASGIKSREQIVAEARRCRSEIEQIFADAEHWNERVRKPHEAPIDPDPDGKLAQIKRSLDTMLAEEEGRLRS